MSNQAYDAIISRRSVKNFAPDPVPEEVLDLIAFAGQKAPSGQNRQPSALLVVQDEELRNKLSELNADALRQMNPAFNADPFYGAPAVIAILANPQSPTYLYDGSVVMENLQLAAHALGYGACWIHRGKEVFAGEEGKEILRENGIPEDFEGIGFVIVGTPAGELREAPELKSIVKKVL